MTMIDVLAPTRRQLDAAALLVELEEVATFPPFAPAALAALDDLSGMLLRDPRAAALPMFKALGFWLRAASLAQLKQRFDAAQTPTALTVPVGLTLHIAPANVETMFVYSWALALLLGNRSLVRLSSRRAPTLELLASLVAEVLARHPRVAAMTRIVSYPHDAAVTAALSLAAALRVVWGGDAAVAALRQAPLGPQGRELVFPNRFSLAVVAVDDWQRRDARARRDLAEKFFNDLFWFDQRGCSSPRAVFWVGDTAAARAAHEEFCDAVAAQAATRGWVLDLGGAVEKTIGIYDAVLALDGVTVDRRHAALTSLWLDDPAALSAWRGIAQGGGVIAAMAVASLEMLVPHIVRRDQTLAYAGFTREAMHDLARTLNGRGIDRIVPVGRALAFDPLWDGYDLLAGFGRVVSVE